MRLSSVVSLLLVALCFVAGVHAATSTPLHRLRDASAARPSFGAVSSPNLRPVIGILTLAHSDEQEETASSFSAAYVKWLEQAGARVAVVPFNAPRKLLDEIFESINGLLLTGGSLVLHPSKPYFQTAKYLFERAKDANDRGEFFPIWGTCQGFQLLNILASRTKTPEDVLKCLAYDSTNIAMALEYTPLAATSKLFEPARYIPANWNGPAGPESQSIYEVFGQRNITQNLHNCGVSPTDFYRNEYLPNFFKVLSTNVDKAGKPFVSTVEGISYPFYGVQWHPERIQFEWNVGETLAHDQASIAAHAYLAHRFVMEARQSEHKFRDEQHEMQHLIYKYEPVYTGASAPPTSFPARQTYEFDFKF